MREYKIKDKRIVFDDNTLNICDIGDGFDISEIISLKVVIDDVLKFYKYKTVKQENLQDVHDFILKDNKDNSNIIYDKVFREIDLNDGSICLKIREILPSDKDKQIVMSYTFDVFGEKNEPVGICDFRVGFNQKIFFGGNIGYTIFEKFRGYGYASKSIKLLIKLAKMHKFDFIYVTCDINNIASAMSCKNAGGIFLGNVNLPIDCDMYKDGDRKIAIYKFIVN